MYVTISKQNNEEMASRLQGIILRNYESRNAYGKAVDLAVSSYLKSYFRRKCVNGKRFDRSLNREVSIAFLESQPTAWHQNHTDPWMDAEGLLCSVDDASMLKVAIAGDRAAVSEYNEVLEGRLFPFEIHHLIRKHKMRIEVDLYKFKKMGDLGRLKIY